MEERAFHRRSGAPPQDRELVVLDPHLEVLLAHAGHFDLERVAIGVFEDGGGRRDKLLRRLRAHRCCCDFRELKYSLVFLS